MEGTTKKNPQIWFAGDCHGEFSHVVSAAKKMQPNAIIFLEDLECSSAFSHELRDLPKGIEVAYIPGNHDSDYEVNWDNLTCSTYQNLHAIVASISGLRIAGLGGVFRKPWYPKQYLDFDPAFSGDMYARTLGKGNLFRGRLPLRHRTTIFPADVTRLAQQKADVLVTHEAPGMHSKGFEVLTVLAQQMEVTHAFHGHLHEQRSYSSTPWVGVGFRAVVTLSGEVVVEPSESD